MTGTIPPSPVEPADVAATFCATLVDQWARLGLTTAVVSPGSRSTPLVLALAADDRFGIEVFHDERAASFAALGYGRASGRPALLVSTSGTAGAHFTGAVIEAGLSDVPLVVCTADRPPEMWDIGAPQTIDQTHLFGRSVRWFVEPGVAEPDASSTWRALANQVVAEARGAGGRSGPVHINLPFREPLVGTPGPLPAPLSSPSTEIQHQPTDGLIADIAHRLDRRKGIIVAGAGTPEPRSVLTLGEALGWPVVADHRSGARAPGRAVGHADGLLRHEQFRDNQSVEVVLRFGEPLSSKALNSWIAEQAAHGAEVIAATPGRRWVDPDRHASVVVPAAGLADGLTKQVGATTRGARGAWLDADEAAADAISRWCREHPDAEPAVARAVVDSVHPGTQLVVASSMPVRLVEWYGGHRTDISVRSNRGANGIDGTISTGIGVALGSSAPTVVFAGDVAFLHDSTALINVGRRSIDMTVVVVDNDGGGIFSYLPQATEVADGTFELLFGTPHGVDLGSLCAAHSVALEAWEGTVGAPQGVSVLRAAAQRSASAVDHADLVTTIGAALS